MRGLVASNGRRPNRTRIGEAGDQDQGRSAAAILVDVHGAGVERGCRRCPQERQEQRQQRNGGDCAFGGTVTGPNGGTRTYSGTSSAD